MDNIEMRWCIKETEKVLQFRKYQYVGGYAGFPPVALSPGNVKMQWTDWCDVPTVTQGDL